MELNNITLAGKFFLIEKMENLLESLSTIEKEQLNGAIVSAFIRAIKPNEILRNSTLIRY